MFLSDSIPLSLDALPSLAWRQIPDGLLPTAEYVTNTAGPAMYPQQAQAPARVAGLSNEGYYSSKCAAMGGECLDKNLQTCDGNWQKGICPGPSNIVCCVPLKDAPTEPGKVYTSPPPGVNTAGFGIVPMIIIGLIGIGIVYEVSQRK